MARFKVNDLICHPKLKDLYYRVTSITDPNYRVDQHWVSDDTIRYENQSGPIYNVDKDFIYYKQSTQIRRP